MSFTHLSTRGILEQVDKQKPSCHKLTKSTKIQTPVTPQFQLKMSIKSIMATLNVVRVLFFGLSVSLMGVFFFQKNNPDPVSRYTLVFPVSQFSMVLFFSWLPDDYVASNLTKIIK